jgi:uncharacterized sulfatase
MFRQQLTARLLLGRWLSIIAVIGGVITGESVYVQAQTPQARPSPAWLHEGVIYQIWLRSFTSEGTLRAAAERLPWIRDLGATIVYLPPVQLADDDPREEFWSPRQVASHLNNPRNPYRIKDYFQIDPEYGSEADLRAFVDRAHQLGLRVLMDAVFYHCGPTSVLIDRPGFVQRDKHGKLVTGSWHFPLLNFNSPGLREYLWRNLEYYVEEFDVDGFRCDVADAIPLDFWEEARSRLEKVKPDLVILAEGQNRPSDQLKAFDINYSFTWAQLGRAIVAGGKTASVLQEYWETARQAWPTHARFIRFSANHDLVHDRENAELVCGERGSAALTVINFTIDGVPFLYNGQEIGDTTLQSIYGRWPIRWEAACLPKAVARYQLCQKLCLLRRNEKALSYGETVWLKNDQQSSVVSFLRKHDDSAILTAVNLSNRPVSVAIHLPDGIGVEFRNLLAGSETKRASDQRLTLQLNAFDYFVGKSDRPSGQTGINHSNKVVLVSTTVQQDSAAAEGAKLRQERPNILWLTLEDVNCHFGCYGDSYATTPNIDRLAAEGVRYTHAIAGASVCTPCRSTLITGMYAVTLGSQHLRSPIHLSERVHCFPKLLREAGYYCTNNVKQDYNFECPPGVWDESSRHAHWRNRPEGRPFFAVFNTMVTHQSRVRMSDEEFAKETASLAPFARHDPQTVPLPPYFPDTSGTRKEMARYYDMISAADSWVGQHLRELQEAGLDDETIVFVFGDNGAGIPRHKRALYDSGVRVPLIIRFPKKYEHLAPVSAGGIVSQVVSFVDFAPTVLALAGVEIPDVMQGQPFLGKQSPLSRDVAFLFRDRVDEVFELSRGLRNQRFKYIRNFMPHRPYMEISEYCEPVAMVRDLRRLAAEGRLEGPAALYLRPRKPIEELYDLEKDPHELHNLAEDPSYTTTLEAMREQLRRQILTVRDTGFLPEGEMFRRAGKQTIWEMAQSDAEYPLARIYDAADSVGRPAKGYQEFVAMFLDGDPAVRYWGVVGLMSLSQLPDSVISQLLLLLSDDCPEVRIAAAEALCRVHKPEKAVPLLAKELRSADPYVRLYAASTLAVIGRDAAPARESIMQILGEKGSGDMWMFTQWALARCCRQLAWPIPAHVPVLY